MTWFLAIDFGTSNTAAAHATWNDRTGTGSTPQVVPLTHAGNLLPSVCYIGTNGEVLVGQAALNAASTDVFGLVPAPKRLVTGGGSLPPRAVTIPDVVGQVIQTALNKARAMHDNSFPKFLVLTHPEAWTKEQRNLLREAAARVGIPQQVIRMTSEPRAAVRFYGGASVRNPRDDNKHVAVFDFGGGTLDIAVLRQTPRGPVLVVAQGDNGLGGRNFDAYIRNWVEQQLHDHAPQILEELTADPNSAANRQLARDIREAKEVLSDSQSATIAVSTPAGEHALHLTRREFAELIEPELDRAIALLNDTLSIATRKGMHPQSLEAVYLTGGSSRIPAVHTRVQQVAPMATLDDPKTVVARGAVQILLDTLTAKARTHHSSARPTPTVSGPTPTRGGPTPTRGGRPQPTHQSGPVPPSGARRRSGPVGHAPSYGVASPSGPVQVSRPAINHPPPSSLVAPKQRPPAARATPARPSAPTRTRPPQNSGSHIVTILLVVLLGLSIAVVGILLATL